MRTSLNVQRQHTRNTLNPMIMLSRTTRSLEDWFLQCCEKANDSCARLSGEGSLYEEYVKHSSNVGEPAVGVKEFAKRLELLMALHYDKINVKARDSKGILFRGIRLKGMVSSPAPPESARCGAGK